MTTSTTTTTTTTRNDQSSSLQEPLIGDIEQDETIEIHHSNENNDSVNNYVGNDDQDDGGNNNDHLNLVDGLPVELSYLLKSLYFLEALGSSTWGRFGAIYYNLHGLNPQQIGLLEGFMTAIPTLFSMPVWGFIADHYNCRRIVYVINKASSTILILCLAMPMVYNSYRNILIVSLSTQLFTSNGILDSYTIEFLGETHKLKYGRYRLYASLSWGMGAITMGYSTDYFGFEPNFILYGLLGFACLFLVATKIPQPTFINNNNSTSFGSGEEQPTTIEDETCNDEYTGLSQNGNLDNGQGHNIIDINRNNNQIDNFQDETDNATNNTTTQADSSSSSPSTSSSSTLTLALRITIFLIEVILMGAGMATVERLLFLYAVNDLHASNFLCGMTVGVNVIFEIPIFWYASDIVKWLNGLDGMLLVSMACFFVRVWGYTLLQPSTRYFLLVLEVLHGFTFACFWIVCTDVIKTLIHLAANASNRRRRNSNNSANGGTMWWSTFIPCSVQMLYSALGVGVGSILGGWAMHVHGARFMYHIAATTIFCTFLMHLLGTICCRYCFKMSSFLPTTVA